MKTKNSTFLSKTMIALCGLILTAPYVLANEGNSVNNADEKFIKYAAAHDMEEVKLAQLGALKAVNPEIKAYAEKIVAEHTQSGKNLVQLAAAKRVDLSGEIKTDPSSTYQDLDKTERKDFDKKFLDKMVESHEENVTPFEGVYKDTKDAEVKAYAMNRLPILKARHEKVIELRNREVERNTDADNTGRNIRDRDDNELTPFDQGSSKSDTEITATLRKEILAIENMSTNAKNVKIITKNGKITLRGPVDSLEEKRLIEAIATRVVTIHQVDSQLEVKTDAK